MNKYKFKKRISEKDKFSKTNTMKIRINRDITAFLLFNFLMPTGTGPRILLLILSTLKLLLFLFSGTKFLSCSLESHNAIGHLNVITENFIF